MSEELFERIKRTSNAYGVSVSAIIRNTVESKGKVKTDDGDLVYMDWNFATKGGDSQTG